MPNHERIAGERRKKFYVALVDNFQCVTKRLSPVFDSEAMALAALARILEREPDAVLIEEILQRFVHEPA